uniref:SGNH hydrolase-type esterase domain-containing protein n=1 Tax=Lates calcarifer TaxID=8187 RepID=A0A4W6EZL8_LATCA
MACVSCSVLEDRVSLLERRVRQLEQLLSPSITLDMTGTPDSVSHGLDSEPVRASLASSAVSAEFVPVSRRKGARKSKQPVVWPGLQSPLPTANRFSTLASPVGSPVRPRVSPAPADRAKQRTLVIGDSITRNVRLASPANVYCLPGARASDIEDNLRVLASRREKQGAQAHCTPSYSNIVIHVGTNNIRMKQSEVTKASLARTFEFARKMCRHRLVVSGLLPMRGNDEVYSRLTSLNRWLARHCSEQGYSFVDNWPSFWGRPDLLKADGLHPTGAGAAILSRNIDRCLRRV